MPAKYIPYVPDTVEGQAVLSNIARARRVLRYRDDERVVERIQRGMPLYETNRTEIVGEASTPNLLLRGECLSACAYLKDQNISVDLVYIDPPFASGADYAKQVYLRRHPHKAAEIAAAEAELEVEELRAFEEKMYGDIWNKEDYLNWMWENLHAIKSVMSDNASIYVHLDEKIGHYVKVLMDEVFGESNFQREIIWAFETVSGFKSQAENWITSHNVIFYYTKGNGHSFNKQYLPHKDEYIVRFDQIDKDKRRYRDDRSGGRRQYLDESQGRAIGDVWNDIMSFQQAATSSEITGYSTQKPESLLSRILKSSSEDKREDGTPMIVADFFGGSGVTAKVAHDLKRQFIHVDVGVNSLQTARDRLKAAGASFQVLDIQDGVSLFRNPAQTMDKLKNLVTGLRNEDKLDKFWEGAISDPKLGTIPVYLPNLLDHNTKVLDTVLMSRILNEAMPDLPDGIKRVIVYYVDIANRAELEKFIKANNKYSTAEVELRDLKTLLDQIVLNDEVEYSLGQTPGGWEVQITKFVSDRLQTKIDDYNAKRELGGKSTPLEISDDGLELIEWLSLDCTNAGGAWQSDVEIKIDKKGFTAQNGKKTKTFWDAKIASNQKPLRLKLRNIAGDESILVLGEVGA